MKIFDELDFNDILNTSWSGAVYTANKIEKANKGEEFCQLIEELYPEGIDRTHLNDLLWFEGDWVLEQLGISEDEEDEDEEE